MSLREQISADMKEAMKAGDKRRTQTLRLMNSAIKDKDINSRTDGHDSALTNDAGILELFIKMVKQRQDSIAAFDAGGRTELAQAEREEMAIILQKAGFNVCPSVDCPADDETFKAKAAEEIKKCVMSIVTDSGEGIPQNVFAIHKLLRDEKELFAIYKEKTGKYKELKELLIEDLEKFINKYSNL